MTAPDRFGRYRVVRRIGSGAFATVWLARDEVLEAPVAVKVLADNWAARLDVRERFEEEARILRRADSDRVVRVHDIGELEDGRPYFVMTYADRGTLASVLTDGPLPVGEALRYGADIARGLAVLHQVGVIHRDVNPGNVLLRSGPDGTERVLIADLGLAKAAAQGSGFTLTVGTPGYTAPEQATPGDTPLDRRADVYSIGAVLLHMLTGTSPLDSPSLSGVPFAVAEVVRQAMAPLPGDRYPSAGALADALDAAAVRIRALPGATVPPYQPPDREDNERIFRTERVDDTLTLSAPRRRRRWIPFLVVLLVLAGAGTAAAVVVRDRRPVTVTTTDGAISLRVPPSWAAQERRTSWDVTPYGGKTGIALVAAPSVTDWASSSGPGVFAGRADGVAPAVLLARSVAASCPATEPRELRGSGLTGTLTRHVCSSVAYAEAVLQPPDRAFTVYVQVKEPPSGSTADAVIRSLVVNWTGSSAS